MVWNSRYGGFAPYVSVAKRKKQAEKKIAEMRKKGKTLQPVLIEGRAIAKTFWGKSWCENLESYSDFENRLPRGRTYARNGSVIDLQVLDGKINGLVSGSRMYTVKVSITPISKIKWNKLVKECIGKVDSLIDLLQGKISKGIMQIITNTHSGLFPAPSEMKFSCSCPDIADMCKHVAAVLYGVGARLDEKPEDLFKLRKAVYGDLVSQVMVHPMNIDTDVAGVTEIKDNDLSVLFGIDIDDLPQAVSKKVKAKPAKKAVVKKAQVVVAKTKKIKAKPLKKAVVKKAKAVVAKIKKIKAKPAKKAVVKKAKVVVAKTKKIKAKPAKKAVVKKAKVVVAKTKKS
jgi:uncharacterized Zn finger protein